MHVEYRNQKEEKKIKNIRFQRFRVLDLNILAFFIQTSNIGKAIGSRNISLHKSIRIPVMYCDKPNQ
jgi:hypothetical protein